MTEQTIDLSLKETILDVETQEDIDIEFDDRPINVIATLEVELSKEEFPLDSQDGEEIEFDLDTPIIVKHTGADPYTGAYVVEPTFETQTLQTKNKFMRKDIEVDAIAVSRVSNLSGGTTVYIGGKFDG